MSDTKRDPFMGLDRQLLTGKRVPTPQPQEEESETEIVRTPVPRKQRVQAMNHDSDQDIVIAPTQSDMIQTIRKAVRTRGNEQSIHRLTREEKRSLKELVYNYDVSGTRTSENEITRIAINYLLTDHKIRGQASMLTQVLAAMNE